jgi:hypothetical protein
MVSCQKSPWSYFQFIGALKCKTLIYIIMISFVVTHLILNTEPGP